MHALQVLPIVSFYFLKNTKLTIGLSLIYGLLALLTLIQAIQGRPLIKGSESDKQSEIKM